MCFCDESTTKKRRQLTWQMKRTMQVFINSSAYHHTPRWGTHAEQTSRSWPRGSTKHFRVPDLHETRHAQRRMLSEFKLNTLLRLAHRQYTSFIMSHLKHEEVFWSKYSSHFYCCSGLGLYIKMENVFGSSAQVRITNSETLTETDETWETLAGI